MSVIRYWPVAVFVVVSVLLLAVLGAVWAIARWRSAAPLPPLAVVVALIAVVMIVGGSIFSMRPGFLAAPGLDRTLASQHASAAHAGVAEVEVFLSSLVDAGAPPGLTAVVVRDGEVVYARGFGLADGPGGVPATAETTYRWWSITKVFTAVAIMQLAEQGRLTLDDAVTHYVPEFEPTLRNEPVSGITIRHLLSHSSGLPDAGNEILGWLHFEGDPALDQTGLVRRVLPDYSRLASAPGTEGRYTNIGYMVLSAVIEAVSGERYEDYVTAHILAPLRMDRTGFDYSGVPSTTIAVGSHPVDVMTIAASFAVDMNRAVRQRQGGRLWFERVYPDQTGPSGLVGPASDMARFMAAMLAGGELGGTRILSESSVDAMALRVIDARVSPAPGKDYGFGLAWFLRNPSGQASWSHGGQGMGMSSLMTLYPAEGLGVLVVGNSTYLGQDFGASAVAALAAVDWTADEIARD